MKIIKGRGWHGDTNSHKRTGSLGGKATAKAHGKDFYARIGKTGGKISGGNLLRIIEHWQGEPEE